VNVLVRATLSASASVKWGEVAYVTRRMYPVDR
jgi:hypothetical protein